jgi:hypothetical protein
MTNIVNHNDNGLPREIADRFTKPFHRFLNAGLAYSPAMHAAAKVGILVGSAMSGAAGLLALGWLSRTTRAT